MTAKFWDRAEVAVFLTIKLGIVAGFLWLFVEIIKGAKP